MKVSNFLLVVWTSIRISGNQILAQRISNSEEESGISVGQCKGLGLDTSRLISLSEEDDASILQTTTFGEERQSPQEKQTGYSISQARKIERPRSKHSSRSSLTDSSSNLSKVTLLSSSRLQATYRGLPVHGSNLVVTTFETTNTDCKESTANISGTCVQQNQQSTKIRGKFFRNISVSDEMLQHETTPEQARQAIANHYNVSITKVGRSVALEIYPTLLGDYLVYFGDVLVKSPKGSNSQQVQLYEVVVNAMNMQVLCDCQIGGYSDGKREISNIVPSQPGHRRNARLRTNTDVSTQRHQNSSVAATNGQIQTNSGLNCDSDRKNSNEKFKWNNDVSSCPLQSLYLNNTNKQMPCVSGQAILDGTPVFSTGPVPILFWGGTYDCQSSVEEDNCQISPIMDRCNNARHDVQYVATKTMQFLDDQFGILGGNYLSRNPRPLRAFVHYDTEFCNALFRGQQDTLYFGDCDCQRAGAMVSPDIVAHEISHFVTWHTSRLASGFESGGLNEGYADILGTIMEWVLHDDKDEPDFFIGESTGLVTRNMEQPSAIQGLESVCHFDVLNGSDVHAISGPLNKAYVRSIRACQQSRCATSTTECVVLLGSIFLHSNYNKLTRYSGFLDAATASCESVEEYFLEKNPNTTCSIDLVHSFLQTGWASVDVSFDGVINRNPCRARKHCEGGVSSQSFGTKAFLTVAEILNRIVGAKRRLFL